MGMSFTQLEGWTTKQEVKLLKYPVKNPKEGQPTETAMVFLTLMVKRGYKQTVKDANGNIVYEDGKPMMQDITDAIKIKFRDRQAIAIHDIISKNPGKSRHLWIMGTVSTYESEESSVLVRQSDGKLKPTPLYASVNGQKIPLKFSVSNTVFEVSEFRFLDPNPNINLSTKDNNTIAHDLNNGIIIGEDDAYTSAPFLPMVDEEEMPF